MDKFYNETLTKLENEIKELEIDADCSIERIEAVIKLINLKKLKDYCGCSNFCLHSKKTMGFEKH
ncbi:hypothetical protein BCY91_05550 [Pelobium manganitolerans]|uniref:Uncharacterized protein n=1 Tax=Pelobium manganitolerans TaxID=1842495 RepID=A0A419S666_9SPHI|nr:hypothetical protein [Pelobium manganitolerans]RKD16334.1 hypothetical protein BCY91_05550 [Pelobium manganitolerans]